MPLTVAESYLLESVLGAPEHYHKVKSRDIGYDRLISCAITAHDETTGTHKVELARLLNNLYHWMAFDSEYPPPPQWGETMTRNYRRFYRASPFELGNRLAHAALNFSLVPGSPAVILMAIAFLMMCCLPVLYLVLWILYPFNRDISLWLDHQYGPYSWLNMR